MDKETLLIFLASESHWTFKPGPTLIKFNLGQMNKNYKLLFLGEAQYYKKLVNGKCLLKLLGIRQQKITKIFYWTQNFHVASFL